MITLKHSSILLIAIVLSSLGCVTNSTGPVERALSASNICIQKWELLSKSNIPDEVNRAYVHLYDKGFSIMFTKGEFGSFGNRSADFRNFMTCVSASNDAADIYYLGVPPYEALLDRSDDETYKNHYKSTITSEVLEILLRRGKNGFQFEASQGLLDTSKLKK